MKILYRITSIVVLTCFLFNTAIAGTVPLNPSIGYRDNRYKLAVASIFSNLKGIEHKDIGKIKFALEMKLKEELGYLSGEEISDLDFGTLKSWLGYRPMTLGKGTLFYPANIQFFFVDGMEELPNGYISVKCRIKDKKDKKRVRTYYAVFSSKEYKEGGFPIEVYTEKEYDREKIAKAIKLIGKMPERKGKDRKAIKRYVQQKKNVGMWIWDKMQDEDNYIEIKSRDKKMLLDFLGLEHFGVEEHLRLVPHPDSPFEYPREEILRNLNFILGGKIKDILEAILKNRRVVLIKVKKGEKRPAIYEEGKEIKEVGGRTSQSGMYVFMDEGDGEASFDNLKKYFEVGRRSDDDVVRIFSIGSPAWHRVAQALIPTVNHEIGAACGFKFEITEDIRIINDMDRLYKAAKGKSLKEIIRMAREEKTSLVEKIKENLTLANLDHLRGRPYERDYAFFDEAGRNKELERKIEEQWKRTLGLSPFSERAQRALNDILDLAGVRNTQKIPLGLSPDASHRICVAKLYNQGDYEAVINFFKSVKGMAAEKVVLGNVNFLKLYYMARMLEPGSAKKSYEKHRGYPEGENFFMFYAKDIFGADEPPVYFANLVGPYFEVETQTIFAAKVIWELQGLVEHYSTTGEYDKAISILDNVIKYLDSEQISFFSVQLWKYVEEMLKIFTILKSEMETERAIAESGVRKKVVRREITQREFEDGVETIWKAAGVGINKPADPITQIVYNKIAIRTMQYKGPVDTLKKDTQYRLCMTTLFGAGHYKTIIEFFEKTLPRLQSKLREEILNDPVFLKLYFIAWMINPDSPDIVSVAKKSFFAYYAERLGRIVGEEDEAFNFDSNKVYGQENLYRALLIFKSGVVINTTDFITAMYARREYTQAARVLDNCRQCLTNEKEYVPESEIRVIDIFLRELASLNEFMIPSFGREEGVATVSIDKEEQTLLDKLSIEIPTRELTLDEIESKINEAWDAIGDKMMKEEPFGLRPQLMFKVIDHWAKRLRRAGTSYKKDIYKKICTAMLFHLDTFNYEGVIAFFEKVLPASRKLQKEVLFEDKGFLKLYFTARMLDHESVEKALDSKVSFFTTYRKRIFGDILLDADVFGLASEFAGFKTVLEFKTDVIENVIGFIRAFADKGNYTEALRILDDCRNCLPRERGITPSQLDIDKIDEFLQRLSVLEVDIKRKMEDGGTISHQGTSEAEPEKSALDYKKIIKNQTKVLDKYIGSHDRLQQIIACAGWLIARFDKRAQRGTWIHHLLQIVERYREWNLLNLEKLIIYGAFFIAGNRPDIQISKVTSLLEAQKLSESERLVAHSLLLLFGEEQVREKKIHVNKLIVFLASLFPKQMERTVEENIAFATLHIIGERVENWQAVGDLLNKDEKVIRDETDKKKRQSFYERAAIIRTILFIVGHDMDRQIHKLEEYKKTELDELIPAALICFAIRMRERLKDMGKGGIDSSASHKGEMEKDPPEFDSNLIDEQERQDAIEEISDSITIRNLRWLEELLKKYKNNEEWQKARNKAKLCERILGLNLKEILTKHNIRIPDAYPRRLPYYIGLRTMIKEARVLRKGLIIGYLERALKSALHSNEWLEATERLAGYGEDALITLSISWDAFKEVKSLSDRHEFVLRKIITYILQEKATLKYEAANILSWYTSYAFNPVIDLKLTRLNKEGKKLAKNSEALKALEVLLKLVPADLEIEKPKDETKPDVGNIWKRLQIRKKLEELLAIVGQEQGGGVARRQGKGGESSEIKALIEIACRSVMNPVIRENTAQELVAYKDALIELCLSWDKAKGDELRLFAHELIMREFILFLLMENLEIDYPYACILNERFLEAFNPTIRKKSIPTHIQKAGEGLARYDKALEALNLLLRYVPAELDIDDTEKKHRWKKLEIRQQLEELLSGKVKGAQSEDQLEAEMVAFAGEVGIEIAPPAKRYTLLVPYKFYKTDEEYEKARKAYSERCNLVRIGTDLHEKIVPWIRRFIDENEEEPDNVIVQLPKGFIGDKHKTQIEELTNKAKGIKLMIVNTHGISQADKEKVPEYRHNILQIMRLMRAIDKDTPEDSKLYRLLHFYIEGHLFGAKDEPDLVDEYMEAIMHNDIEHLLTHMLSYRPIGKFKLRKYKLITYTLRFA